MTEYNEKKDEALVELTLLGNERAYEELVVRYERAVKGTAYKITKNEFSAEDASQDAFVSAWMNLDQLRERDKFGSWVCSIAKNHARNLVASYKSRIADISYNFIESIADSDESGLLEMLGIVNIAEWERDEKLREAVGSLGEKIREAIELHYFDGLSVAQIASRLSIPEGTVKWRLCEGRKQLRKEYGIMEKTYNENESLVTRVMRQVEQLKLWRLKKDKSGFEEEYRAVLAAVESLEESKDKQYALAEVLIHGYWWLPGKKNREILAEIKKAAQESHNDEVMQSLVAEEYSSAFGDDAKGVLEKWLPELLEGGFKKALGYVYFWLGNEYFDEGDLDRCEEYNKKVMEILGPTDVYYANAKSVLFGSAIYREKENITVSFTGEVYRYIDGKLYFWSQPGYERSKGVDLSDVSMGINALFWNCSACDNLIYDPTMKPRDVIESSDKKCRLTLKEIGVTVKTPAGVFENCSVTVLEGEYYGLTYAETYFCPEVGIVRQIATRHGRTTEWSLVGYEICGGEGMTPFAVGNRWEYTCPTDDIAIDVESIKNIFEVTGAEGGTVTVSHCCLGEARGYNDNWQGNMIGARYGYHEGHKLVDVSDKMRRAAELAATKREKLHTSIATDVMDRIHRTDPTFNPDYTEKGRWNFFSIHKVERNEKSISIPYDGDRYNFEWKDMKGSGDEGYKVLHNFLYDILDDAVGCVWSDEWACGYHLEKKIRYHSSNQIKIILDVLPDENVSTPAGVFENCRHVYFDLESPNGGWGYRGGKKHYWFAEGVGIVKMKALYKNDTLEAVWELTEYKGRGEGYFPTEDGLFRRYEPSELSDGWHALVEYTFDRDEEGTVIFRNALGTQDRANYEAQKAKK